MEGFNTAQQTPPGIFPKFVGHRRRLLSDNTDLFQDSACPHDATTRYDGFSAIHDEPTVLAKEASLVGDPRLAWYFCHKFECTICHASLPTAHLLDLHIAEMHDSFFAAQAARRMPVYACLVEACHRKFCTIEERRQHLLDFHRFPRQYSFDRLHLRRKKAQIRPLPHYQKSNNRRRALSAEEGAGETEEAAVNQRDSSPSPPPMQPASLPVEHHHHSQQQQDQDVYMHGTGAEIVEGFSRLRMAAETSEMPDRFSFGRRRGGRGLPWLRRNSAGRGQQQQRESPGDNGA